MLLNNDAAGRWVNGSMGTIVETIKVRRDENRKKLETVVKVRLDDPNAPKEIVAVTPHKWKLYAPAVEKEVEWNEDDEKEEKDVIVMKRVGTFTQFPFKLGWAVTIHKSQGKTFDDLLLDTGRGIFAEGQLYTALSRCRTLEGLNFNKHLLPSDVKVNEDVRKFMKRYEATITSH